jgi:hypothetical protein
MADFKNSLSHWENSQAISKFKALSTLICLSENIPSHIQKSSKRNLDGVFELKFTRENKRSKLK